MKFAPLYSFVEVIRNGANIKQAKTCTQGIPITRIETISNNKFNWDKLGYASIFDDKYKNFYLEDGDVLFSHINSKKFVGRSVLVKTNGKKIIHGMNLLKIRFKKDIFLPKFFIWYSQTQSFKTAINAIIKNAVNQSSVSIGDVKNIPVPSIDLHKQREIVENLNNIEQAIQVKEEQLKALDELIQSRFTEMFGQRLLSARMLLSEIATFTIGLTYKPENVSEKGTIVLRSGNIQNNELALNDDIVRVANIKIPTEKFVKNQDILMCSRNGSAKLVGKSCLICNPTEQMVFGAFMTVIRTSYPYFLQSFFTSQFFKSQLTDVSTASVKQITSKMLKNYLVIKPRAEEERQFAEFVQQVEKAKEIVKIQIKDLQELLALKMDEYFK